MRTWRVILAFWLVVFVPGQVQAATAVDAILQEVSAALAAGQYEDAVTVAGSGLAEAGVTDITRSRLLVVRGLARQALGSNDDALADFTQALSIGSLPPQERARALFARGVSLDSLNRLDDAAGDYNAVLRLWPRALYALNNRANVYRRQGRLDDARRDYLAALKGSNPNPQYPYFGLGQIAEAQGDADAARGYYNKALAAAPGFALALERLQALGAPVEGPLGLPADTGVIVLKPPPAITQAPVTLHPPEAEPAVAAVLPPRAKKAIPPAGLPSDTSLRPTIVDAPVPPRGGNLVQLGAWRSEREARDGWTVMQGTAGGLLDGLTPIVVQAEIPGRGIFYRLRTAATMPVSQFCTALAARGLSCLPVRD